MQENNFSELSQQRPQIKREMKEKPTFSYLRSGDIMYQKLIDEERYAKYEDGLLESIYTNGYSDQYSTRYINETLEKNNLKLFAENKAIAEENGLLCSDIFGGMERDNTFLYLSRDSKHFMAVRTIKDGDIMKLYVVNSSPKAAYLPKEGDEIIKRISMEAGVKNIVAREIKPAIYQLGNFACFVYALKNAKELSEIPEAELDLASKEKIDEKKAIDENLFSISSYQLFKGIFEGISSHPDFTTRPDLNEDDAIRFAIAGMKSTEERFGSGSIFVPITFDKTRLILLNKLRSQRKAKYLLGAQARSSIPEQQPATAQVMGGRV